MRDKTWRDMKAQLASSLLEEAEKIGWPMAVEYAACDKDIRLSFERAFVKLLQLRQVKIKLHEKHSLEDTEGGGLYPIEALVHPIALRFKYHFDGTRQTNRLDKPEWYFTHILNIAHEHRHFMNTAIQHILAASGLKHISAWREFAYLLLPILSKKLKKTIPMLLSRPSLFAHTIHQAVIFDAAYVEEGFQLQGTSAQSEGDPDATWEGISTVILSNYEWFNAWLQAERNFVEGQYNEIISAQDAWTVSDDSEEEANAWDLKPTNSARRVKALFNQITDRFSPLPSPVQRTQFLVSIQLTLLESYHSRISSSLDAFETLSNAFLRAVPGALALSLGNREEGSVNVDAQNLTTGVAGVQRLCKALISATYIRAAIEAWSEDTFFLELWQDISNDPPLRHYVEQSVSLPNLDPENSGDEVACGTIFDEVVSKYQSLIARTETMVVQQVCGEIEGGLRAHFVASTSIAAGEPSDGIGISQTLLGPLALLSSDLTFLAASLPQHILTNLYRRIASRLSEHILHRQILYRGSFSRQEGASLQAECELWVDTCHTALGGKLGGGRQRVEAPWSTLLQAGRLVGSSGEPWETITNATFGTQDEVEWEQVMLDVTGVSELSREDVSKLLRRRND
ncbi:RINT-1 family protein, variant 2 [Coprinopsis cinerea AmutBmut pab1-1]|nr:RINT-1 family protein, variant 2 [Coprinopsis cinerea AmutBmut pab1-1]